MSRVSCDAPENGGKAEIGSILNCGCFWHTVRSWWIELNLCFRYLNVRYLNTRCQLLFRQMSEIITRIREIRESENLDRTQFGEIIGYSNKKLSNIENGLQRAHDDVLESIAAKYPQYAYWLISGNEIPEAGQISPMTEKARRDSKTA
ncbi:MAG: helix-turn-helix domain-containing protein [Candidatus Pacearchaeota archaeon]|nr:helix-turn-helix domain-containing protein [Candidatus Pacearchaeota archaeon]